MVIGVGCDIDTSDVAVAQRRHLLRSWPDPIARLMVSVGGVIRSKKFTGKYKSPNAPLTPLPRIINLAIRLEGSRTSSTRSILNESLDRFPGTP